MTQANPLSVANVVRAVYLLFGQPKSTADRTAAAESAFHAFRARRGEANCWECGRAGHKWQECTNKQEAPHLSRSNTDSRVMTPTREGGKVTFTQGVKRKFPQAGTSSDPRDPRNAKQRFMRQKHKTYMALDDEEELPSELQADEEPEDANGEDRMEQEELVGTEENALFTSFRVVNNKGTLPYDMCTFDESAWAASPSVSRRKATSALLDTGCTAEVCGSTWLKGYGDSATVRADPKRH